MGAGGRGSLHRSPLYAGSSPDYLECRGPGVFLHLFDRGHQLLGDTPGRAQALHSLIAAAIALSSTGPNEGCAAVGSILLLTGQQHFLNAKAFQGAEKKLIFSDEFCLL